MKKRGPTDGANEEIADLLWINPTARMVRQEVVDRLRDAIRLGQFTPGQRLLERELCQWTGVSRTSIREALRQLESEGLVENIPRRGPAVSVISPDEVRDIYDVRVAVEPYMVELFIDRATDKEGDELVKAANALDKAARSGGPSSISTAKGRFFDVLMSGCRNQALADVVRSLHLRLILVKSTYLQSTERWPESVKELKALAQAIKDGNPKRASKICREHLDAAASAALSGIDESRHLHDQKEAG